jgi:hypothetical protein
MEDQSSNNELVGGERVIFKRPAAALESVKQAEQLMSVAFTDMVKDVSSSGHLGAE